MSSAILWTAIGASVIILSLLVTLFLRERKREVGILLALGEKRGRIVFQFLFEVMLVAFIAVILSLLVGNLISASISENMLVNDLVARHVADQGMTFSTLDRMGFSNNVSIDEVIASYSTSLDATTTFSFFLATISTVLLSTIIPMLYILRLNPRKIMM